MSARLTRHTLYAALATIASGVSTLPAAADVVHLKNGQTLEGIAIETGDEIAIRSAVGEIRLPARLIDRIERGETVEAQALRRLERLGPNDVEGRLGLAMELDQAGANTLARRILDEVLAVDPDHPGARRALGYLRCDGEWLSKEDCHAKRGEVFHQGRWINAADRSMLEALELERRQSELQRLQAQIQIDAARLEAERLASLAEAGQEPPFGYLFDPYLGGGGGLPFYPTYGAHYSPFDPFDPIHGDPGRRFGRGDRFGKDGRLGHDGRHGFDGRFDFRDGRRGFDGRPHGFVHGGHRLKGGLHWRGGQPPRPVVERHNTNRLAPASPGVVRPPPAGVVPPPRPAPPTPGS